VVAFGLFLLGGVFPASLLLRPLQVFKGREFILGSKLRFGSAFFTVGGVFLSGFECRQGLSFVVLP
jgi:hypothetical protein